MSRERPDGARGFTMTELMVVVAILGITAAVAVTGFRSNPTGGAARKTASIMATALRTALGAGATTGICTSRAHLKIGMYQSSTSYQLTVYRLQEDTGTNTCVEQDPYISSVVLDDDVEIYAVSSYVHFPDGTGGTGNQACPPSPSATSLSTAIDKNYNSDGTADGFVIYLRHKYNDNATRYCVIGMPLSPSPLVFQDW